MLPSTMPSPSVDALDDVDRKRTRRGVNLHRDGVRADFQQSSLPLAPVAVEDRDPMPARWQVCGPGRFLR